MKGKKRENYGKKKKEELFRKQKKAHRMG